MSVSASTRTVRLLRIEDLVSALSLSTEAGWNQTAADWRMLIALEPEGCFACVADGQVVGTTTLLCYGTHLGWIGMVLTKPEFRRRGIAQSLLELAIRLADERGIRTLKLDATAQGQRLYEKLGFRGEQAIERWVRDQSSSDELHGTLFGTGPLDAELDEEAMAADRTTLLRALVERHAPFVSPRGYAAWRDGIQAVYLGPCVARDRQTAKELIEQCLKIRPATTWFWDLLPAHTEAVQTAQQLGFRTERRLMRMVRGETLRGREELIFAIAGFELG